MYFSSLTLNNFRNYESQELEFGPGICCFNGNNGAGKTNLLEALHYLAMTRGFQAQGEKYVLRETETFFMVEGGLQEQDRNQTILCSYMKGKGKKMLINGKALRRMSEHIGRIPLVLVLPNDTQLIYGGPSLRRKFMDAFISQYDPEYLKRLIRYDKALEQRNAQLSLFFEQGIFDADQLALWDRELIPAGQYIVSARQNFHATYAPIFKKYFNLIVSDKEDPTLTIKTQFEANTTEEWESLLRKNQDRDRYSQRTSIGIHKDDLEMTIDGQAVKNFGSQGQQKTFVIALKFAQYEMLEAARSRPPVLLLDDIFDKLDVHRLKAIAGILDGFEGQTFVTDTTFARTAAVFGNITRKSVVYFQVESGSVTKISDPHVQEEK